MNVRDLLAQTVSLFPQAKPVTDHLADGPVATRGTDVTVDTERDIMGNQGVVQERVIRVPVADLPTDPAKGGRVDVGGETWRIQQLPLRSGQTWLLRIGKVSVR